MKSFAPPLQWQFIFDISLNSCSLTEEVRGCLTTSRLWPTSSSAVVRNPHQRNEKMTVLLSDETPGVVGRRVVVLGAAGSVGTWYFWPQIYPLLPPWLRRKIVRIKADIHGSFYVSGRANGFKTDLLFDTGCCVSTFPKSMIQSLGLDEHLLRFDKEIWTANGVTKSASFRLRELVIAGETFRDIPAEIDFGDLDVPLLGTSFSNTLPKYEVEDGYLTLHLA
jgi:clan AA aspartic protease (TIGR02281 family)